MAEYLDCILKAGYYKISGLQFAEHTFVIAEKDGDQYALPCFGGFALREPEDRGHTGVVYPAELWSPYMLFSRPQGKSLRANLFVALGMAQGTLCPRYDYKVQDWDTWWAQNPLLKDTSLSCNAGIAYGVTGVCQQACNRILWASQTGNFTYTPVNWPPSFSASYWVYGYYGKVTEAIAGALALGLIAIAAQYPGTLPPLMVSFAPGDPEAEKISKAEFELQENATRQTREALMTGTPAEARQQEIKSILEAAPGGKEVAGSSQLDGLLTPDARFNAVKAELDKQLLRAEISHNEYAEKVNRGFTQMVEEFRNVLPPETFKALFPEVVEGGHVEIVVREQMPESYEPLQETIRI
ncbi:MAG: hypothetical protein JXA21_26765 [Anaerolineae bacterium]|nr:hypothetical protein [Anaerolineae bacterium]